MSGSVRASETHFASWRLRRCRFQHSHCIPPHAPAHILRTLPKPSSCKPGSGRLCVQQLHRAHTPTHYLTAHTAVWRTPKQGKPSRAPSSCRRAQHAHGLQAMGACSGKQARLLMCSKSFTFSVSVQLQAVSPGGDVPVCKSAPYWPCWGWFLRSDASNPPPPTSLPSSLWSGRACTE